MSLESILNWILEATTTILAEGEIIRRIESLQQILIVNIGDVKSVIQTLQSVWTTLFPKDGCYALKTCIVKTLLRFKEEMIDYKEFAHLIFVNITITHDDDDDDDANAIKVEHEEEEFAHLMLLVTDLCSTVFGPRSWFRINDQIEVCIDGEMCHPATYLGRHHIDGQCIVLYHSRYHPDGRLILEPVPNCNILGKRKKIPLGPFVEDKVVEFFHDETWRPAVTKKYLSQHLWRLKCGERYLSIDTSMIRSYQPIDDRRLCDANKDNFRFLCRHGKGYSHIFFDSYDPESDEEAGTVKSETPDTPETASAKTLSVCNLPDSVQRADVEYFFKDAGEVVDLRFSTNEKGMFRGLGLVEFASVEAAMKALDLNGRDLLGHAVRIASMDFNDGDSSLQQSFRTKW